MTVPLIVLIITSLILGSLVLLLVVALLWSAWRGDLEAQITLGLCAFIGLVLAFIWSLIAVLQ